MPAHNEEEAIANTVHEVLDTLTAWNIDFELIVVNDGSKDRTGLILDTIAAAHPRLRVIHHLERFFPLIHEYDAVLGYRVNRQDTWMRKLNAWGWKILVGMVFGVYVRDVDCAFKLYRADFFREHKLETRGAMINTEILYKFTRAGYTFTQVGVRHLPRRGGRATGAKLSVILRAFREMAVYAYKWHREEKQEEKRLEREKARKKPVDEDTDRVPSGISSMMSTARDFEH